MTSRGVKCSPAFLQIYHSLNNCFHKGLLFNICFKILQRLHHCDSPAPAGQNHLPVCLLNLIDNLAGIHFEYADRDKI